MSVSVPSSTPLVHVKDVGVAVEGIFVGLAVVGVIVDGPGVGLGVGKGVGRGLGT